MCFCQTSKHSDRLTGRTLEKTHQGLVEGEEKAISIINLKNDSKHLRQDR